MFELFELFELVLLLISKIIFNVRWPLEILNPRKITQWPEIGYDYFDDTDNMEVRLIEGSCVEDSVEANNSIIVFYDIKGKIISFELFGVTELLLDFKPSFVLNPVYHEDSDILTINFVKLIPHVVKFQKTELKDIEVGLGNTGKIVSILFRNAFNNLAKPLTEKEKVIINIKMKEERERLDKLLMQKLCCECKCRMTNQKKN